MAVSVTLTNTSIKPKFWGKEIRGVRRHYQYLRKKLGKKKLLKKIKQLGNKEKRTVDDYLHKISRAIVTISCQEHSLIVLGDLKGIRKLNKGRNFNRIVSNWAYYKLTKMIEYKANWEGIRVIKIDERETSHICSRCGSKGKRPKQGIFNCSKCGLKNYNADINGAVNIAKKLLSGYNLDSRALSEQALNSAISREA